MAMNIQASRGDVAELDVTPLIGVLLVLLALLILAFPAKTDTTKLAMPAAVETPPGPVPPVVRISVDYDGAMTWNGEPISRVAMDARFSAIARKPDATQDGLVIDVSRFANYDAAALVLTDAQRLGVTHIGFARIDQYN